MRELRGFVELFDKNDVKSLFDALSSCMECVRMDLHIFDSRVTCLHSNDLDRLSIGNAICAIARAPYLFEAFMEYASPELKAYYNELTKEI